MLEIRCRHERSTVVLELEGELCLNTVAVLDAGVAALDEIDHPDLVIDVGNVTLLTAEGITMLLRASRARARRGGSLTVRGATGLVGRVLDLADAGGPRDMPAIDLRSGSDGALVTIHEAADTLGVTARDVHELIAAGIVHAVPRGRTVLVHIEPDLAERRDGQPAAS